MLEKLMEDVRKGIEKLSRETTILQQRLRSVSKQDQYDLLVAEIERNQKLEASLNEKLMELAKPGGTKTEKVGGQKAAHTLDLQIRDTIAGIQQDYRNMLARKSKLDLERSRLYTLRLKLDYNVKLLAKPKAEQSS